MFLHPDMMLALANEHHRELIAEADQRRLLNLARLVRRAGKDPAARERRAGTLAPCETSAAVPVR
jgi:hypothetical protein